MFVINFRLHGLVIFFCGEKSGQQKMASPSGNRTPVSRVTGGDTYHYTNEDYWLRFRFLSMWIILYIGDNVDLDVCIVQVSIQ